MEITSIEEET
jgi:hypothetical protein